MEAETAVPLGSSLQAASLLVEKSAWRGAGSRILCCFDCCFTITALVIDNTGGNGR